MQSWPGPGQNGSTDEHGQWQSDFGFAGQNAPFDPSQSWSQAMPDQAGYAQHISPQETTSPNYFTSEGDSFLPDLQSNTSGQPGYHGHDNLSLSQQYGQPAQDVVDPAFSSMNPDLYTQQGKLGLGDSIDIAQPQGHPHAHSQTQAFPPHEYAFAPQNEQPYESPAQQFAQPHLVQQQSRQQSHTPVQQYENLHNGFVQSHGFSRPPQQSPVQHQQPQQPPRQTPPQYHHNQAYSHPQVNGQHDPRYQANPQLNYQQPPPQQQQQNFAQPGYAQKPLAYPQPGQASVKPLLPQPHRQASISSSQASPGAAFAYPVPQSASVDAAASARSVSSEPAPKKRKRVVKTSVDSPAESAATLASQVVDLTNDLRRTEEVDSLVPPVPTAEEQQLMTKSVKRNKATQAKQPSIKGLPHLLYNGSVKLPAPKSYDKLAPLVALPSRSGKPMVPELGYNLPCEVQGKFTSSYRPSAHKLGLDERRTEAKVLLDNYDNTMKRLGKRRPKYTEYPHAFKEQLKTDEATKNRAEKRAKKELEESSDKPVRPPTRPTDLIGAAVWDVVGFVHIDKPVEKTGALIGGRVQQAGDFLISLRSEANRVKLQLDQSIKDKEPEEDLKKLRDISEQKKEALFKALDATLEHADDRVLDNLGGHQKLVLSLVNTLIACIKASDFSGKMPRTVLELFTQFRMTKKIAETTNFDSVRKRFADKGDEDVKELVRELNSNIRKALKAAEPETATGYTGTSAASRAKSGGKIEGSSAKRTRDDEADSRTVKKIAVESGGSSLSKKLAQPKTAINKPATSILPGKSRPVAKSIPKVENKPDSPAGSGEDKAKMDAQKATKAETKPPAPKMGAAPSSSALSGIASLLDSINTPKPEVAAPAPKKVKGPELLETPEQKVKRLRKEARRKLRVSWKPEAELVQTRIFHKDDDEDEGREVNMIRDAADDRSEGMVLKQRANVEEDDEDDDVPYQPWSGPLPTDFSRIPIDIRGKSFVTRGGTVTFTTGEQQRITEREQRELMALYTDPADIPLTPRSPPPEMSVPGENLKIGRLPEDVAYREYQTRYLDNQQMGPDGALFAANSRMDMKHSSSTKLDSILGRLNRGPSASQSSQSPSFGHNASPYGNVPLAVGAAAEELLLAWLSSHKVKTWWDPIPPHPTASRPHSYPDLESRASADHIEEVSRALAGKAYPATSPPKWIVSDEERVREWWFGFNKEVAARQRKADEAHALANAAAGQSGSQDWSAYYAQQQQYAPYLALMQQMAGGGQQPQQQQQQPPVAPPPPAQQSQIPDSQLQSILAAINQPSQPQQQQQQATAQALPQAGGFLNPNDPSYQQYVMLAQMAQGGQQAPAPAASGYDSDREWEDGQYKGEKNGKDGRQKKATLPPHKPANKALIGTKPCTFWQQGKCARGDKCTFRHD